MKTKEHVFIGTDINRTTVTNFYPTSAANSTPVTAGEIFICDKNKKLMTAGMTVGDTDGIYIGMITSDTYTNSYGYTGYAMKWSPLISADKIKSYTGQAYTAGAAPHKRIYGHTPTANYETVLRLVYSDNEVAQLTPGQFTQEWRVKPTGATTCIEWNRRIAAKINADTNSRVTASVATGLTGLRLVAKTKTGQTLNDIDDYNVVNFSVSIYTALGQTGYTAVSYTEHSETAYTPGHGNWQQVRDAEKKAKSQEGLLNQTIFPVPTAVTSWSAVLNETYDCVTIKYDKAFITPDMGYEKNTDEAAYIYIPNNRGNQMTDVLAVLNDWMGSLGFTNVSL